ncbi:perlucin-like isoform X1 [Crassostrea virginica]|uniref:Perlucin-like n=1 Tax=Crassostrea virginica TaxID=6565 RepID=A0A8B8ARV2_CRAVI|nr:perlucin-like [Crassostrea virginica]
MSRKLRLLSSVLCTALYLQGVSSSSTCQDGWTGYNNVCYLFITHMKASWNEAIQFCQTQNSRLAEIEDAREDNFIRQHLLDYGKQEDFWVGGTDVITEGDWIWVLSQTPIIYYSHWALYEPNNLGGSENCLEISYGHHYFWNDDSCSRAEFFICEQPSGSGPVVG